MPENVQGQFEKRLYLNTRIKSGGTYTTEGPHGLAFAEELNNYVTENQNTSITLGSSDHRVSILFDGPSTFVRDGIGITSSVPALTSNKLYNNNGDLYWSGTKLNGGGSSYEHIVEDPNWLYLGWKGSTGTEIDHIQTWGKEVETIFDTLLYQGFHNATILFDNIESFIINGPGDSSLVIGPDGIEIASDNSITIEGPTAQILFDSCGIHLGSGSSTTIIEGPSYFNNILKLNPLSSHPSDRYNNLYNKDGDLYWNYSKLGYAINYIYDDAGGLYLGKYSDTDYCQYVEIKADNVRINDTTFIVGPDGISLACNNSIIINGPNNSIIINGPYFTQISLSENGIHLGNASNPCSTIIEGPSIFKNTLRLDSLGSHPSNRSSYLYNKDGELYWGYNKLGYEFNYILEGVQDLAIGKIYDTDYVDCVAIKANKVKINDTTFIVGPNEVRFYNSILVVGPSIIQSGPDNFYFGTNNQATTVTFCGPVRMSDPLYLLNLSTLIPGPFLGSYEGDLYWDHSKVSNSIIDVPYQDVADEVGKRGLPLTLENNTIYNFDPDHEVNISNINVKPWNTPQLHLYFNNTSSGKIKMTFTYPSSWKWINQSTPPSSSDFKEGYLYCIALRSVANPVYSRSSTTPPYNQEYIVIANIAYEVPVDV